MSMHDQATTSTAREWTTKGVRLIHEAGAMRFPRIPLDR